MENAGSIGIAGGAIALSLVDMLVMKGILTEEDRSTVLDEAQSRIAAFAMDQDAATAARIISSMHGFSTGA